MKSLEERINQVNTKINMIDIQLKNLIEMIGTFQRQIDSLKETKQNYVDQKENLFTEIRNEKRKAK